MHPFDLGDKAQHLGCEQERTGAELGDHARELGTWNERERWLELHHS